jgi:hypothetical protein
VDRIKLLLSIVLILSIFVVICHSDLYAQNVNTPAGSFISQRAVSVAELVRQVRKDPIARQRYAKHFGIASKTVAAYFERNLKLVSIKKPLRATVWYVGKKGVIHTKTKLFPKGTAVFVDRAGRPVLVWSCGNPLAKKLITPNVAKEKVKGAPLEVLGAVPVDETLIPSPEAKTPTPIEELVKPAPIETVGTPPLDILPEIIPLVPAAVLTELPAILIGGGGGPSWTNALILGSIPIIGSIFGGSGGNGGGGGGGDESLVPEPVTLLGFGLPLLMVGLGKLRRMRK